MSAFATLSTLEERGYRVSLDPSEGDLVVKGPGPVPEDLRREIIIDTAAIKAAVLLSNPPGWLAKLFDLCLSGQQTPVRFSNPASGKTEVFMVSVSIKNICTAVAAEIGAPVLEWERLRPEVEEVLGKCKWAS